MIEESVKKDGGENTTSLSLLDRAKADDNDAWIQVRDLYLPLVYKWCRNAGVKPDDLPDLGQEVMLAVARSLKSLRHDQKGDTFRGWLRRITQNKIVDLWRNRQGKVDAKGGSDAQQGFAAIPFENSMADDSERDDEELHLLHVRAVQIISSEFPTWYATAFERLVEQDENAADVAADMGKKVSAVYNAKSKILRRLRETFSELLE